MSSELPNLSQDGVSIAFTIIQEELDNVIKQLQIEGMQAFQQRDFNKVAVLGETGKDLDRFKQKVLNLQTEWEVKFDQDTREMTHVEVMDTKADISTENNIVDSNIPDLQNQTKISETQDSVHNNTVIRAFHSKSAKTNLRTTLADGRVIFRNVAADSFVEVLRLLGIERIKALNITVSKCELVSLKKHPKYNQHRIGQYFVMTHTSTIVKRHLLESIGQRLKYNLKVEIV